MIAIPMSKSEREDLLRLIKKREQVHKTAAEHRSAVLMADFEAQMARIYDFNEDEIWKAAMEAAEAAVKAANGQLAARCAELKIPADYAPAIHVFWTGRGENAVKDRQAELRRVAKTRIAAIEKQARVTIEMASVEAQTTVVTHGLTSAAAKEFIASLPAVEALMPPLDFKQIEEQAGEARKTRYSAY